MAGRIAGVEVGITLTDTENISKLFFALFCGGAVTFSHELDCCSDSHKLEKGKKSG